MSDVGEDSRSPVKFWAGQILVERSILYQNSSLFDPLGWFASITVIAKVLIQDLWLQKYDWDFPLPAEVHER